MTEIFEGLPPGHSLFEQFSFIGAEELPEFVAMLRRSRSENNLTKDDRTRLLSCRSPISRRDIVSVWSTTRSRAKFVRARELVREEIEKVGTGR